MYVAGVFRITAAVFVAAVVLNYPWEMAQSFLFEPMGPVAEASWRCFVASLADGLAMLGVFAAGSLVHRRAAWFQRSSGRAVTFTVLVGALIGMSVESWGLSTGRWQYTESMPRVPILDLGLVPLLQMPILAPIAMGMAEWWASGQKEPDDRAAEDGRMRRS